jgi:hypothetical protein
VKGEKGKNVEKMKHISTIHTNHYNDNFDKRKALVITFVPLQIRRSH